MRYRLCRHRYAPHPHDTTLDLDWSPEKGDQGWMADLAPLIAEESVQHLDDLVFRRTPLGDDPARALRLAPQLCALFNWDVSRRSAEIDRIRSYCAHKRLMPPDAMIA